MTAVSKISAVAGEFVADGGLIPEAEMRVPRLELRWYAIDKDWATAECEYSLVLPLLANDVRRDSEGEHGEPIKLDVLTVPIEVTRVSDGGCPLDKTQPEGQQIASPFRSGAHAKWDAQALKGLPVYVVCEGLAMILEPGSSTPGVKA
jgi:hypothetical protein